jgi:serine/threonine protein kinase
MKRYERSLADLLKSGPLTTSAIRSISHALCRTLAQLHRAGVVVQDIKPQNVLLDSFDSPVFSDFGIAGVVGRTTKIMPTSVRGTFNYMAPEVFEPPFGDAVDIWSMGCVILEMSTGSPPWGDLNMQQIMMAVTIRKRAPDVLDSVPAAEIVRKCFAFDPKSRPTADEMADAFRPRVEFSSPSTLVRNEGPRFERALATFMEMHVPSRPGQFVELPIRRGLVEMYALLRASRDCNAWIAGGAARWMCSPRAEPVATRDVDIFPSDEVSLHRLATRLELLGYTRLAPVIPSTDSEVPGIQKTMAWNFVKPDLAPSPSAHVQLVVPRKTVRMCTATADVTELLRSLDFSVCRAAVVSVTTVMVDKAFEKDETNGVLRIRNIVCPITAVS